MAKTKTNKKQAAGRRASKKKAASKTKSTRKKAAVKTKRPTKRKTSTAGKGPQVTTSPSYQGKPQKLPRDSYPAGASANDFDCFGPPATADGDFTKVRICDMGCFTQDGKDSNKYYHGAIVQHNKTHNWYAYFEWGRTGAAKCSFQFVACESEAAARATFARQLHAKNDKRGEWVTIAGIRTLRAKKGKDCYLVRPMATRSTGLPDARRIKINEGAKPRTTTTKQGRRKKQQGDPKTLKLLHDLNIATIAYTRGSMADASLPTQMAIDEARAILGAAQERVGKVRDSVAAQVKDKKLMQLTRLMFSRIPRKKRVGAAAKTWVLSKDNILSWQNDLDAFESALYASDIEEHPGIDVLEDMRLKMQWVDPTSKVGKFLYNWWPTATCEGDAPANKMKIKNLWTFERQADKDIIEKTQQRLTRAKVDDAHRPLFQPKSRLDVPTRRRSEFKLSNTALLFHGTRSVNVSGILRESLRMPQTLVGVVITGALFGPGIYFADDWKKSAGYTSMKNSQWAKGTGGVKGRDAFMFAADVVLGKPYIADTWEGFTKPPRGHHSVYGKAGEADLPHNEFIVYNTKQSRLRYLIEFTTTS